MVWVLQKVMLGNCNNKLFFVCFMQDHILRITLGPEECYNLKKEVFVCLRIGYSHLNLASCVEYKTFLLLFITPK